MSLSTAGLQPWLRPYADYLLDTARYNGVRVRITSVRRTRAQQAALYARYLRGESSLPAAPPGRSLHEHGLAFDVVFNDRWENNPWQYALGDFWRRMGGSWSEIDPVHFYVRL